MDQVSVKVTYCFSDFHVTSRQSPHPSPGLGGLRCSGWPELQRLELNSVTAHSLCPSDRSPKTHWTRSHLSGSPTLLASLACPFLHPPVFPGYSKHLAQCLLSCTTLPSATPLRLAVFLGFIHANGWSVVSRTGKGVPAKASPQAVGTTEAGVASEDHGRATARTSALLRCRGPG